MGRHARHSRRWHCWHLDRRLHLAPPLRPQTRTSTTSRRQHRLLGLRRPDLRSGGWHPHDVPGQDERNPRPAELYVSLGEAQHDDQAVAVLPVMKSQGNEEKRKEEKKERRKLY